MASDQQYAAAKAAALKVVQADIASTVPSFMQSEIPQAALDKFAADVSKASVDASDAALAQTSLAGEA
jgi:hypothetical protein